MGKRPSPPQQETTGTARKLAVDRALDKQRSTSYQGVEETVQRAIHNRRMIIRKKQLKLPWLQTINKVWPHGGCYLQKQTASFSA